MINIGIGIGWAKALYSVANNVIANFKARVLSYPNSIFEAGPCLDATLEELNAIGLLDNASLVITPNAYTEGILYDVVPNTTLGDMTVVRATTATRVNSAGLVEVVPRNLFVYSNDFTNANWTKENSSITTSQIGYDGTNNASLLVENSTTNNHFTRQTPSLSGQTTISVYAKANTRNWLYLRGVQSGVPVKGWFNLTNGTLGTIQTNGTGSITSVGNGWYRCSLTIANFNTGFEVYIGLSNSDNVTGYLGNGSSIFIQNAQVEKFATASNYFPTTTRVNIPRIDYTNGSCPSLLVEPQRTNLALNSDGNVSTYATAVNVTNASSSFNSFSNAIQFPSTGTSAAYKAITTTVQTYAISVFIKMDDNSVPILSASSATGNVCLIIAGSFVTNNLKVESYGNNVYRLSGTGASLGINSNNGVVRLDTQVLKSFKITGIQLEAASYPTSYIPTVASTVTRNADVISKTGISSLIGQTEGTIFIDFNVNNLASQTADPVIFSTSGTNYIRLFTTKVISYFESNTVSISSASNVIINGRNKIAVNYKNNDFSLYVNGVLVGSNNSGSVVAKSNFSLNYIPNSVFDPSLFYNSVQLYKTKLTNAESIQLTTL